MQHKLLTDLGACYDGAVFASQYATLAEAWAACQNPAWLVWFLRGTGQLSHADAVAAELCDYIRSIVKLNITHDADR